MELEHTGHLTYDDGAGQHGDAQQKVCVLQTLIGVVVLPPVGLRLRQIVVGRHSWYSPVQIGLGHEIEGTFADRSQVLHPVNGRKTSKIDNLRFWVGDELNNIQCYNERIYCYIGYIKQLFGSSVVVSIGDALGDVVVGAEQAAQLPEQEREQEEGQAEYQVAVLVALVAVVVFLPWAQGLG